MISALLFHALPLAMRLGPFEFSDPLWLFALLLLFPIFYLWKTSRVPASPIARGISLTLRTLLIFAITLALAGTRMIWFNKGICVVFVLDQSQSVPGAARDVVRDRIAAEVQKMSKDDQFAVVEFGGDAVLGSLPSPKGAMPPPAKVAEPGRTDIARALRLALASFPADHQKRIVLFSDGNQNAGDALKEARIAATKDIDVDVLLLTASQGHEAMVEQLVVPPHIRKDANFIVRAILSSDSAQSGKLLISRDGQSFKSADGTSIGSLQVTLKPGTNVIDIPDQLADGGYHNYQVTYVPDNPSDDTFAANNSGYAFTQVDAPGRILLVQGKPASQNYLHDALRATGVPVLTTPPGGLPSTVNDYTPYDCVVMDNVSATDLSEPQMAELKRWVHDFGGGLVLIGGDQSFGPGGYKDTPLEEISPVEMDVNRKKHLASLAVVIVNDKSGSMGAAAGSGTKMDLANAGSVEVLKLLDSPDFAMIGAVDTETEWMDPGGKMLPMTASNKAKVIKNTLSIQSGGGGIYCATALKNAYDLINDRSVNTMAKHVIMFADLTDSEQQEGCVEMAAENYRRGVTTSVIGMGGPRDPHAQFQQEVARAGHGRWAYAQDPMTIPRVFAKEAFLVARKAFVEKKEGFTPTLYTSPLLEGFNSSGGGGVPKIFGYVGTTLKPRATLAMHGLEPDDPLLAHWSIGLGKCVAYTSDSTSRWGKDWVAWNGYAKFWSQVVRWVSRTSTSNGLATTTVIEGADGRIIVDAADDKGVPLNNLQLKANVIAPDDSTPAKEIILEQIGPGRYQSHFAARQRGTYLVTIADAKSNELLSTGGGVLSYPPEYRDLHPNAPLLHALADTTGGTYLSSIDNIFEHKPDAVTTFWPLWQALLIFVTAGLLVDVAWRRLNIADWFRSRPRPASIIAQSAAKTSATTAFRSVKSSRREVDTQHQSLRDRVETLAHAQPTIKEISPATPTAATSSTPATAAPEGYTNRLMSAKKRAADQIEKQSDSENK